MRIAVANLKGGVGKTTLAVALAELLSTDKKPALLVDADAQASAMAWSTEADEEGQPLRCVVVAIPTESLGRRLDHLAGTHEHVVIDTPPGALPIVMASTAAADVVLVPTQPTLMDLSRIHSVLTAAQDHGTAAAVVLSRVRVGTKSLTAAREALDQAELAVLDAVVPQREALAAMYGTRPSASTLTPYRAVLDELTAALRPKKGARRG